MLIDFFLHLKERRLPVSTTEYLSLLEALEAGLANYSLDDFYSLSRICLVKNEAHYDRFDLAFAEYFRSAGSRSGADAEDIPENWLNSEARRLLSAEDFASPESLAQDGSNEEDKPFQAADGEDKNLDHRKKITVIGSNSSFGDGIFQSTGIRLDNESAGNRRAVRAWDSREYKGLDDEVELGTRHIKMALRRLRKFAREGAHEELDLDGTISGTARNAGWLDLRMRPERRNKVKVLILFDIGGSMDTHVKLCEELFSAVRAEFKQLEYFYFHNCVSDSVWRYNGPHLLSYFPIPYLLNKFGKDYKLIIVGDASMSPVEIMESGEGSYHKNASSASGEVWMGRLLDHYRHAVWVNPEQERYWHLTQSIQIIRDIMEGRMYPLTLAGLDQAMKALNK